MPTKTRATLKDLARFPGKAELIDGEIVPMAPTGDAPGTAGDEIYYSPRQFVDRSGFGHAVSDNKAFRVDLPHRQTLSPDAAFYTGPRTGMFAQPLVQTRRISSRLVAVSTAAVTRCKVSRSLT